MADRETIIDTGGGGGGGAVAAIIFIALVVLGVVVFLNYGQIGGTKTVDVDVPAVSVGVTPDGQ